LSRDGDDDAAKGEFDLVLSGKPLEITNHGRKGKYSMEVSFPSPCLNFYLNFMTASVAYAHTRCLRRTRSSQTTLEYVYPCRNLASKYPAIIVPDDWPYP
jgi:hypothetical protein